MSSKDFPARIGRMMEAFGLVDEERDRFLAALERGLPCELCGRAEGAILRYPDAVALCDKCHNDGGYS